MPKLSADARSFIAFYQRWADLQGWRVPSFHYRIDLWLADEDSPERVLMVFRGAGKSTKYAVYKAWKLWRKRSRRSLVWSADNDTAGMLTADTINVLRNHPWCVGILPKKPGARRFWVNGATDARNASMRAVGVNTNATGARADDVDFDDVEVPGNIETPEARLKLRQRISESTHIAVPGAQKTYIGTPHTHDSIYPERIAAGAAVLKIPLFEHSIRYEDTDRETRYPFEFAPGEDGLYVLSGIHKHARLLVEGVDYRVQKGAVVFAKPPCVVIDICANCAWSERFTRKEIERRRKETRTLNGWDSQYQLEAKPLGQIRLDPDYMQPYEVEPVLRRAHDGFALYLGMARMVSVACRWDPSSGKVNSDISSLAVVFQDAAGRRYWHRSIALIGDIAKYDERGERIIGGQVLQIVDAVRELKLPRVTVETNGIGQFAPTVLRAAFKQAKMQCAVVHDDSSVNKNKRILEAVQPVLTSNMLWAHTSVLEGDAPEIMRSWNPQVAKQVDDPLDALAGAITEAPERLTAAYVGKILTGGKAENWQPQSGVFSVELEA
ncbi:MAG: phage terminase large subunit [Burkholderiaceae bacterium]